MDNYNVVYQNLPYSIGGFVMYDECDQYYTIVLNSRCSYAKNKKTFLHEMKHILQGDFCSRKNVAEMETLAHI